MASLTLSNYLAMLRDDPDSAEALDGLGEIIERGDEARLGEEPVRLLEMARQEHEQRGELGTVARLIELEIQLVDEDVAFAAALWKELGRLHYEDLLDVEAAHKAYDKARELAPDEGAIQEALKRIELASDNWEKFAERFADEAKSAADLSLKTSLLVDAASMIWRFKNKGKVRATEELFQSALEIDPAHERAVRLYERTLRQREKWEPLARMLVNAADAAKGDEQRQHLLTRAARVYHKHLGDRDSAAKCFERVLAISPRDAQGLSFLVEYFTEQERWDDLVKLYEDALRVRHSIEVEQGMLLQIGMVHWRMRQSPDEAEPYFLRLRKLDPAHPAMLDFYREYLADNEDPGRLLTVLTEALRVVADDERKLELAVEVARTAQKHPATMERAIDAWKLVQRLDPSHREASSVLKDLFRQARKWNALVDVLKTEIEAASDDARKVELLHELVEVYRDQLQMDVMVINTYKTILELAPRDLSAMQALADKYEAMGRWNDLIQILERQAETLEDKSAKVSLYLRIASLWIERFANYNQATEPLERVLELEGDNREALGKLKEIYRKRRGWEELFQVLRRERELASDPDVRVRNTVDMARLASERLQRPEDAIQLWREVHQQDPSSTEAIDALERIAERARDWATLAEAYEKRLDLLRESQAKIAVLQKLGALYMDRLDDPVSAEGAWRRILELDPANGRAMRTLRDSLMGKGDWDGLEALYAGAGDWEGLVDVLGSAADAADDGALKVALSQRAARIYEGQIGEPARAFRSYERILSVDPDNLEAARALMPIYEREEKWNRLVAVTDVVMRSVDAGDRSRKLELLQRLQKLCAEYLRDAEAAMRYAAEAYELAPDDAAVRQQLEEAADRAVGHERLVELYLARADKEAGEEAIELRRRVAQIALDRLGRSELAEAQLRHIVEAVVDDAEALGMLERIYRADHRYQELRDLLVQRLAHEQQARVRAETLRELVRLEEDVLEDIPGALAHCRTLSELKPDDGELWVTFDRLSTAAEAWEQLSAVLRRRIELEEDPGSRIELQARLGGVLLDRLGQPRQALGVFGQVLEAESGHAGAVVALERIASEHEELASEVAPLLEEAYERTGRYDKLRTLLKQRLDSSTDEQQMRELRLRLAEISGTLLGDAVGAYGALEAAFVDNPEDPSLWDKLLEAAEQANQYKSLVSAYCTAIEGDKLSDADRAELSARVAKLYDEVLAQPEEAEPHHRRVLAHDPLDERAFTALKELYTSQERWEDLQALYRSRIGETTDAAAKLELLFQVCFLFEEILNRPNRAIDTYQEILELEPDHAPALRTLERLYQRTERWRDLAGLLRRNLDQADGQDMVDLSFRLGELHDHKLGEPAQAVDYYEAVLNQQPTHLRAQEALDRLLSVEEHRQRIARILEPLYENQGAYGDLVRILEIQLEDTETPDGRCDLLARIGELHEQRLHDTDAAFDAYARAVGAEPSNARVREEMARIADERESYRRRRVEVLQGAVESAADSPELQGELLLELGRLLDERLAEEDAAERVYQQLLVVDADNPEAVLAASRALARIHDKRGDHGRLAEDLRQQIRFEEDDETRRELLVQLGSLLEEVLGDIPGAIDMQRQRLELDPSDVGAMHALERLYERTGRWQEMIEVLEMRDGCTQEAEPRRQIAHQIGAIYEEKLDDLDNAIGAYRDALDRFGPHPQTLGTLGRLYEAGQRWDDLLANLELERDLVEDDESRAKLLFRAAELLRLRLNDVPRAIETLAQVLEVMPGHQQALAALDEVMDNTEVPDRVGAARVALPHHEAAGAHDQLLHALEVLALTDDVPERLQSVRRAAEVAEGGLEDTSRAFDYMGQAVRAATGDDDLELLLDEYDRLARASARWKDYVQLLQDVAPDIFDGEIQVEVYRKIAETARARLDDAHLARDYFAKVTEQQPDDRPALDALDELLTELGDHAALIDVLRRKVELSAEPDERQRLLLRIADIQERGLQDPAAAIEALEELLLEGANADAYQALERLYVAEARWDELAGMYEQQMEREAGERVELLYKLGRTSTERLGDPYRALDLFGEAIKRNPDHQLTIDALERMMEQEGESRAVAAALLEPVYLKREQWAKLTSALEGRLEAEHDLDERKRLYERLGQIYEDQLEDFDGALELYARLFAEDPRDEPVWDVLARLARVGERYGRLAEVYAGALETGVDDEVTARLAKVTGKVYDTRLNNLVEAGRFFSMALAFEQQDEEAFNLLESVHTRREDHAALVDLYRTQSDVAETDERRIAMLHKRARVLLEELSEREQAVDTYREILEVEPHESEALQALERIFVQNERWEEMLDLLRHQVDLNLGTPQEVELKYRVGELLSTKLDDKLGAIETYEDILQIDPNHAPTIAALEVLVQDPEYRVQVTHVLEPIYRQQDQWKKLIAILEARIELQEDPIEAVGMLTQVGQLHETRGKDASLAFHAWARAQALDPLDEEVRRSVDRLAAAMGAWDEHVAAYEEALKHTSDPTAVSAMLTVIARVHDEKRGDPRAAIETYERLVQHDPDDPTPLDSLEALHTMVGDWDGLVEVLERKVEQAFDPVERGELLRRAGSVLEELLRDPKRAVDAYRRAVTEDDTDEVAYEALDRLYTAGGEAEPLGDVLRRRIELAREPDERVALGLRLATLCDQQLHRGDDAIEAYRGVLEDDPEQLVAIEGLEDLYERQAMWPDLLDLLRGHVDLSADAAERVRLLQRAGGVLHRQLEDAPEAIATYRQVLEIDPHFEPAIAALVEIGDAEEYRIDVADILEPLFRTQDRHDDLVRVLERKVSALTDPVDRRDELRRIAEVHEQKRDDLAAALEAHARALAEDPADQQTLVDLERLAERAAAWERLADVYAGRASSVDEPDESAALYRRLARVAEQELGDDMRAIEAFQRAREKEDDPSVALADLDRLYVKTERHQELARVLEERASMGTEPAERADLLYRLGVVRQEQLGENRAALEAFREALEAEPDDRRALHAIQGLTSDPAIAPEVVELLDSAYRQSGDMQNLAELFELKIGMCESDAERLELLRELAALQEHDLADRAAALATVRRAFELNPADLALLDELERLAEDTGAWEQLRGVIEAAVSAPGTSVETRRDLNLRGASWYRERMGDPGAGEQRLRAILSEEPQQRDAHEQLVEMLRHGDRPRDLYDALRAWAQAESDEFERLERLREAATLAQESLDDVQGAAECLEGVLAADASDMDALERLSRIKERQERWEELVDLLNRRFEYEVAPQQRVALSYRVADIWEHKLGRADKAVETLQAVLEQEPSEDAAMDALERLYEQLERWDDLRALYERRLEVADSPEQRVSVRLGLASLEQARFGQREAAIQQLREILAEDPNHMQALSMLERFYTDDEAWDELAELMRHRIDQAELEGRTDEAVGLLLRLATHQAEKLNDVAQAIDSYERVLEANPAQEVALEGAVRLHWDAENFDAAAQTMERALDVLGGPPALSMAHRLAEVAVDKLGDPERAERALRRALEIEPQHAPTLARLKALYEQHERWDELSELLSGEAERMSEPAAKARALAEIAELYADKIGDAEAAIRYLQQSVEQDPTDHERVLSLSDRYMAQGRHADAVPLLERVVASFGGRRSKALAVFHHRLGNAQQGLGNQQEALKQYDAGFRIDLTNVSILRDLGRLCLEMNDLGRAQKAFRALLLQKLGNDSGISKADVYFHLGEIAAKQGDNLKAKSMLERAVLEAGEHEQAKSLLASL